MVEHVHMLYKSVLVIVV